MEISWNVNFLVLFYFAWVVIRSIYISRALSRQYLNWQIIILCAFWQANERFCEIGGFVVEQNTVYSSRHNHFSGNATNMKLNKKKKPNCVAVHWKHLPARHHNIFINTIWSLCKYTPYIHFTSWWRIVLLSFMFCRCRHNFIIYSITSAWDLIKWLNFGCSPWREAGSESQWKRRQIGLDYIASAETETSQLIPLSLFGLFFCVIGGGVKLCAA